VPGNDDSNGVGFLYPSLVHDITTAPKGASTQLPVYKAVYSWLRSQIKMVDFPMRFPSITFAPGDEKQCAVRTATVVPSQIDTLIDAFARGFAVDWNVIRAYWSAHPITDVAQFNRLLEAWPNTVSRMLEDGKFKSQLADCVSTLLALDQHGLVVKACLAIRPRGASDLQGLLSLAAQPQCAPLEASWKMYRSLPATALRTLNLDSPHVLDRLTALLLWASRFGYHAMEASDETAARSALVQLHLLVVTKHLKDARDSAMTYKECTAYLSDLWTTQFCRLLPDANAAIMPASMAPDEWQHKSKLSSIMLTYKDMWDLVEYQAQTNPGFPRALKALCMLTRRRTDADAVLLVCTLLADPLFWTQLATEGRMPAEICDAVLGMPIPPEYQLLFLAKGAVLRFNSGVLQLADVEQFRSTYPLFKNSQRRYIETALEVSNPRLRQLLVYLNKVASSKSGEVTMEDDGQPAAAAATRVVDLSDLANPRLQWQDLWVQQ